MEKILGRFSFIEDHQVRGKWRYIFTALTVAVPLATFGVLMWYFLYESCVPGTAEYASFAESSLNIFLAQNYNYYCASSYSQYNLSTTSNSVQPTNYCCYLTSKGHKSFNFQGPCRAWESTVDNCYSTPHTGSAICFNNTAGNSITILYAQCTPIQTAVVNSIQYSVYTVVVLIYLYIFLRVVKKFGLVGLFSMENWRHIMNNKQSKEKEDDEPLAATKEVV
ncbi:MAG: hypothetical protein EOO89_16700 [Pedobacter sp.]|nr:MAG: hypothetical protein EOO89_16700 [Pedobacter sp.]